MLTPDTNTYDNTAPIFGFKYIRGRVINDTTDHRSRLVLTGDSLNGQVVLEGLNYKNLFANYNIFL